MPQLDFSTFSSQIFWLVISFLLMLIMMRFFIVPRIASIIEQRNRYIENYIRKAEKLQKDALASLEKYNSTIEMAKLQAEQKSKEAEAELAELIRIKSEETNSILNQKIAESELILAKQRNFALEEANKAAESLSLVVLKKLGFGDLVDNKTEISDDGKRDN